MKRILGLLLLAVTALGCGCGGISASKSVSPLDFFLPGLIQNTPSSPTDSRGTNTTTLLAATPRPPAIDHE